MVESENTRLGADRLQYLKAGKPTELIQSGGVQIHRSRRHSRPHGIVTVSAARFIGDRIGPSNGPVRPVRRRRLCRNRRDCRLVPLWAGLH